MAANLLTPILNTDIRNTHFFNGRVLTAEDLSQEQEANRRQHWLLGQALGEGVVHGLEVRRAEAGEGVALSFTERYRTSASGQPILALKSFVMSPFVDDPAMERLIDCIERARREVAAS